MVNPTPKCGFAGTAVVVLSMGGMAGNRPKLPLAISQEIVGYLPLSGRSNLRPVELLFFTQVNACIRLWSKNSHSRSSSGSFPSQAEIPVAGTVIFSIIREGAISLTSGKGAARFQR